MKVRLCVFNVENLFISMAYYEGEALERLTERGWRSLALSQCRHRQKPLKKLWGLAAALEEIDADVILLVEVGGEESLANFNRHFLGDRYVPHFVEGNSDRGIDLAFLVRRGFPWTAESRTNREWPVEVHSLQGRSLTRFSRDVAELRLSRSGTLKLIVLLVHLKSKLSKDRDLGGKDLRTAEAMALAELYSMRRREQPGVPIVVGGDFNAELGSLELELLSRTDLFDFHATLGLEPEARATYFHFDSKEGRRSLVLDYLLSSPELREKIIVPESATYRYKTQEGVELPIPATSSEKLRLPSDHYPVVLTLELDR